MGLIQNGVYEDKGIKYDAKSGQPINSATSPTPTQLAYRESAAAAPTEQPVPSPISRMIVDEHTAGAADPAQQFLDTQTFKQPETSDQIAERMRKQSQAQIDEINRAAEQELAQARTAGQERVNINSAIDVLTGLAGSTVARDTRNTVNDANNKELAAINEKKSLAVRSIYAKISKDAQDEARQQTLDATKSAEDILARRRTAQTEAVTNFKAMASSGLIDFEAFKNSPQNAAVYKYALDSVGGSEDALRSLFALNRPKDQIVGSPTRIGNSYVQAYQNPLTGKISYETVSLPVDLPAEYDKFQMLGDKLIAIPSNWDGDTSKIKTVAEATPSAKPYELSEGEALVGADGKLLYKNGKTYKPTSGDDGGSGGGTGTSDPGLKFTTAQINKGAAAAGMDGTAFRALDKTVQNFYINGSAPVKKARRDCRCEERQDQIRHRQGADRSIEPAACREDLPQTARRRCRFLRQARQPRYRGQGEELARRILPIDGKKPFQRSKTSTRRSTTHQSVRRHEARQGGEFL
jgi:hypothetical protein